jgi:hypothetical protein
LEKFQHWLNEHNSFNDDIFEPIHLHLTEIAKLVAPNQRKNINDKIRLSGTWFNYDAGVARTVVGRAAIEEIARLYSTHGEYLFDKNVRAYLKESNPVNKNIRTTLVNDKSHEFFYLNNGITLSAISLTTLLKIIPLFI